MVVDVDDEVGVEAGDAGPAEVAALHHDEGIGLDVAPARDLDPVDARKLPIVVRRGVGVDEPDLLAECLQGIRHGQLGSDRIAVWAARATSAETVDACESPRRSTVSTSGPAAVSARLAVVVFLIDGYW